MKISVIIPVYNAEKYLQAAVESVLMQAETGEVLLIEDKSPDNSLSICRELSEQHDKVLLYRHPDHGNHGAGASRNLGILKATCEYVAFLDADDFYLSDRFKTAGKIFSEIPNVDGVYEAIGVHCEDDAAKKIWDSHGGGDLTILPYRVPPEDLFDYFLGENTSTFSLDGLVVKRELFQRSGLFFKHLRLHQDTAMNIQMAASGLLAPGQLNKAVAMRRVHGSNRILSSYNRNKTQSLMWKALFDWCKDKGVPSEKLSILFTKYQYLSFRYLKSTLLRARFELPWIKAYLTDSIRNYRFLGGTIRYFYKKLITKLTQASN